jgi:nucleoside-triphosphatase THEP1
MSGENTYPPLLFLITGSQGAGKTTFCAQLVAAARDAGWKTAGLLSRHIYDEELRVAIETEDLQTGETRRLAVRSDTPSAGSKHWQFSPEALRWGSDVLENSTPCDLLVIDELGPLELERGEGWTSGMNAIRSGQYAIALLVIRVEMLGRAMLLWPDADLVEIDTPEESIRKAEVLADQLF